MADSARRVEDCSHRVPLDTGDITAARCNLVAQITGVRDLSLCEVRRDACLACCRSFPPTAAELNPIVASLVYGLCSRIERQGGVDGCDRGKAGALHGLAIAAISSEEESLEGPAGAGAFGPDATLDQIVPAPRGARGAGSSAGRWA